MTIASECLPDSDNELKPYIRLSGHEGIWTTQQQLSGKFRPGQPAKFRFNGIDVGEVDRIQIAIEDVKQLESVYNNAQVDACWIIGHVIIQVSLSIKFQSNFYGPFHNSTTQGRLPR